MKNKLNRFLTPVLLLTPFLHSCDFTNTASTPQPCLEVTRKEGVGYQQITEAKVNQEVFFKACSDADYLVVWPGDQEHDFANKSYTNEEDPLNPDGTPKIRYGTGLAMNKTLKLTSYKYTKPGTYTIVLLSTNMGDDLEGKQAQATQTLTITE